MAKTLSYEELKEMVEKRIAYFKKQAESHYSIAKKIEVENSNILMGKGYNANNMSLFPDFNGHLYQPDCEELNYIYTDTDSCVWLKKNGLVTF